MIRFFGNSKEATCGNAENINVYAEADNLITSVSFGQTAQAEIVHRRTQGTNLQGPNPQPQPVNSHSIANNRP